MPNYLIFKLGGINISQEILKLLAIDIFRLIKDMKKQIMENMLN